MKKILICFVLLVITITIFGSGFYFGFYFLFYQKNNKSLPIIETVSQEEKKEEINQEEKKVICQLQTDNRNVSQNEINYKEPVNQEEKKEEVKESEENETKEESIFIKII